MSGGQLASFVLYATLVSGGVSTIAEVWGDLMRASGAAGRLLELLRSEAAIVGGEEIFARAEQHRIGVQFRNVEFRYPSRPEHAALAGIELEISAGDSVALIGPSGAGKTTLFQLCCAFTMPRRGRFC